MVLSAVIAAISRYVVQRPRVVERVNFIGLRITRNEEQCGLQRRQGPARCEVELGRDRQLKTDCCHESDEDRYATFWSTRTQPRRQVLFGGQDIIGHFMGKSLDTVAARVPGGGFAWRRHGDVLHPAIGTCSVNE